MRWPAVILEMLSPRRFVPTHCPWRECSAHRRAPRTRFRFHRHGSFRRTADVRRIPRFLCLHCRRTFSLQTFAFSYYLKRPELSFPIASGLNAGSAHRQLARSLRCAAITVTRRSARLGRHAMLLLARSLCRLHHLAEPIVYDDFESFVSSQDRPFGMGTAVGAYSWFVYSIDLAPHRRSPRLRSSAQQTPRPPPLRAPGVSQPEARAPRYASNGRGQSAGQSPLRRRSAPQDHPTYQCPSSPRDDRLR